MTIVKLHQAQCRRKNDDGTVCRWTGDPLPAYADANAQRTAHLDSHRTLMAVLGGAQEEEGTLL